MKNIILGGGCFWCLEAVYQHVNGISNVISGYSGGKSNNKPTYHNIMDYAEVVKLTYDDNIISLEVILEIFFNIHDPTTVDRQGNDIGSQYRSIIVCNESEISMVKKSIEKARSDWENPIVTEIATNSEFYKAEKYHQNYYNNNQSAGYCQVVINPKIKKLVKNFSQYLKD